MSKQSEAKSLQGWRKKPDTCQGCLRFKFDVVEHIYLGKAYPEEKNMRCSLGNFKTGKSNTCGMFLPKVWEVKE
ncbi:hypothetical protein [Burkholderia plantarii]|uniref:hypothetical protein n=1 Tax=Burkholderia plantarii TaxID=41899 RepID=UPI00114CA5A2|nr:hypothetical protein [Burkholderia plantarii]